MKSDSGTVEKAVSKQGILSRSDALYPKRFLNILRHPPPLYTRGNTSLLHASCILAVVGSRKISSYNEQSLRHILSRIMIDDLVIASGLALGIDSIAHRIALERNIPTIAIPGSSVEQDCVYPRSHNKLADAIVESGGLLVSPFPPESEIRQFNFPMRNELIAALSDVVLIGSAAKKSGALITARHALNFGIELCVIPGPITDPLYVGSNLLLQYGAGVIAEPDDLTEILTTTTKAQQLPLPTDPTEQLILEILSTKPLTQNEIITITQLSPDRVQRCITGLEIQGLIQRNLDGTMQKK